MDTSNDYLFALQLQNELVDITENDDTHDFVDLTKSHLSSIASFNTVVDLTDFECNSSKQKCKTNNEKSQSAKRLRHQDLETTESVVSYSWETLDPNPDIHSLFLTFNQQYFWSTLDSVVIQWSKRMTVCAGLCRFQNGFCSISLSEPLLKLRPRKDLVETLLHEMIHAYLFLTNNRDHRDRDGHGSEFCKHMYRINIVAGTNISIYHDFYEEVNLYKQHWWKCNGPCQLNKPFYGYVKRCMNRAPGPTDKWWANHKAICGGSFIKVREPEGYGLKKKIPIASVPKQSKPVNKITNFIVVNSTKRISEESAKDNSKSKTIDERNHKEIHIDNEDEITLCPVCNDSVLKDWLNSHLQNCSQLKEMFTNETEDKCKCPACNATVDRSLMNEHLDGCKMLSNVFENDFVISPVNDSYVNCPNCDKTVKEKNINEHLDICISEEPAKTTNVVKNQLKCPCCKNTFKNVIELDDHIDNCLLGC